MLPSEFSHYIPYLEISFALNLGFSLLDDLLIHVKRTIRYWDGIFMDKAFGYEINLPDEGYTPEEYTPNHGRKGESVAIVSQVFGLVVCVAIACSVLRTPVSADINWGWALLIVLSPTPAIVTSVAKLRRPLCDLFNAYNAVRAMRKYERSLKKLEKVFGKTTERVAGQT